MTSWASWCRNPEDDNENPYISDNLKPYLSSRLQLIRNVLSSSSFLRKEAYVNVPDNFITNIDIKTTGGVVGLQNIMDNKI
jgi:hypothetical protein